MKFWQIMMGACASAMIFTGCMTEETIQKKTSDARIELINSSRFKIELLTSKFLVNDAGLLTVDASVLISRTQPLRWIFQGDPKVTVWYRFDWLDAAGKVYPPKQKTMTALPGNIVSFHGTAPSEKYISYRLTISLEDPANQTEEPKKAVKPATAKPEVKKAGTKPAVKPVAAKPEGKKAEAKPAVKPVAAKSEVKKAEAKPVVKPAAKQPKLTEPFN